MSDITPEQALDALENLRLIKETPIINGRHDEGLQEMQVNALHAATATRQGIRALETIAAETVEYGVEMETTYGWEIVISEEDHLPIWYPSKSNAEKLLYVIAQEDSSPLRLVARRVSEPWEVEA